MTERMGNPFLVCLRIQVSLKNSDDLTKLETKMSSALRFAESHLMGRWLMYRGGKILPADRTNTADISASKTLNGYLLFDSDSVVAIAELQECLEAIDGKDLGNPIEIKLPDERQAYLWFDGMNYLIGGIVEAAQSSEKLPGDPMDSGCCGLKLDRGAIPATKPHSLR